MLKRHDRDPRRLLREYERPHDRVKYYDYDSARVGFVRDQLPHQLEHFKNVFLKRYKTTGTEGFENDYKIGRMLLPSVCVKGVRIGAEIAHGELNAVYEASMRRHPDEDFVARFDDVTKTIDYQDWVFAQVVQKWLATKGLALDVKVASVCDIVSTAKRVGMIVLPRLSFTLSKFDELDMEDYRLDVAVRLLELAEKMIKVRYVHDDAHSENVMLEYDIEKEMVDPGAFIDTIIPIDWDEAMSLDRYKRHHKDSMAELGMNVHNDEHLAAFIMRESLEVVLQIDEVGPMTYEDVMYT